NHKLMRRTTALDLSGAAGRRRGREAARGSDQPARPRPGEQVPADDSDNCEDKDPQQHEQTDARDSDDQRLVQSGQPSTRNVRVVVPIWTMSPGFSATAEIRWPLTMDPLVEPRSVRTT